MARRSIIQDIFAIIILLVLIFTFASIPGPIQTYFATLVNAIIAGAFVAVLLAVLFYLLKMYFD